MWDGDCSMVSWAKLPGVTVTIPRFRQRAAWCLAHPRAAARVIATRLYGLLPRSRWVIVSRLFGLLPRSVRVIVSCIWAVINEGPIYLLPSRLGWRLLLATWLKIDILRPLLTPELVELTFWQRIERRLLEGFLRIPDGRYRRSLAR